VQKAKYNTWSGKYRDASKGIRPIDLRKNTGTVLDEFLAMEGLERERALKHAEVVWGRKK
jgi:hypothetical protein